MFTDLTEGKPLRALARYSMPMLISMVFQQLYSIADSVIAGRRIGADSLAAIGASHSVIVFFLALALGSGTGVSVILSQLFGAKKMEEVKTGVYTALKVFVSAGILVALAGVFLCDWGLTALRTPVEVFPLASVYLRIYAIGMPFVFLYNLSTAIFNALGDSRSPMFLLFASSALNIALDLLFVLAFSAGIEGIAWATFIAQSVVALTAAIICLRRIKRIETGAFKRFDREILRQMLSVAVPSILQQAFISLGQMSIQSVINGYGRMVVAGYTAAFKINTLVIMIFTTLSNAVSGFVAQNIGAKKPERVRDGVSAAMKMMLAAAAIIVVLIALFGSTLISLFLNENENPDAVRVGYSFLRIVSPFYLLVCFKLVTDGALRGMREMRAFMAATFADLIARVALSFLLSRYFGYEAIWWVWPLAWLVGTSLSISLYRIKIRKQEHSFDTGEVNGYNK